MTAAAAWLAALLLAVPVPARERACILARREAIAASADAAAAAHHVPVALLLSVAYLESHLGCAARSGPPATPRRVRLIGAPQHPPLPRAHPRCDSR